MKKLDGKPALYNRLSLILLLIMLGFLGLIIIWIVWPYKTLEYEDQFNIPVVEEQVKAGETMTFRIKWCKYVDTPTRLHKRFVNEVVVSLPESWATAGKGCLEKPVDAIVKVPEILTPGIYYLDMTATNKVNPLREVTVHYRTEEFEVIE